MLLSFNKWFIMLHQTLAKGCSYRSVCTTSFSKAPSAWGLGHGGKPDGMKRAVDICTQFGQCHSLGFRK